MTRMCRLAILLALLAQPAAAEIRIVAGNLPPHMDGEGKGREADLLRAVIEECGGEKAVLTVVPFGRHWMDFDAKAFDAVSIVPDGMALPGHLSRPYIAFHNGASVIDGRLSVRKLDDLAGRTAVTFMGGIDILGLRRESFARITEQADQEIHSNLLFLHRVDIVLSDGLMVAEYNRRLRQRTDLPPGLNPNQPVRFSAIFAPTHYRMVFRQEQHRILFDRCFGELEAAGRVDTINRAYIDRYRDTVGDQYLGY